MCEQVYGISAARERYGLNYYTVLWCVCVVQVFLIVGKKCPHRYSNTRNVWFCWNIVWSPWGKQLVFFA